MRFLTYFLLGTATIFLFPHQSQASNNKIGIHILDPSEIHIAAKIINGNNGDWGYVTIPLRANDRDIKKWQRFMDEAGKLHIIPIVRLATVPDRAIWRKPDFNEVVDFSNFLNDLWWPTKIKYVIIFNEPNHDFEWGGKVNPSEYSDILDFAIDRFKSLDSDFFILPAALDAAVPDSTTSINSLTFLRQMFITHPQLPAKLEAINSHSYPNPAFSGRPSDNSKFSIAGFKYEQKFIKRFTSRNLPVFITETGWQMNSLSESTVANYYSQALSGAWQDPDIIAITPFLLSAGEGEFQKFSLLHKDGSFTQPAKFLANLPKAAGTPQLSDRPENTPTPYTSSPGIPPSYILNSKITTLYRGALQQVKNILLTLSGKSKLQVKDIEITVEIAKTAHQHQKGLSDRKTLDPNSGMLFIFSQPGQYPFWMRDMKFPLDFIWIKDNQIVQLNTDVTFPGANESPQIISPSMPIDSVLEVNAGFVERHSLKIGDTVTSR